MKVKAKWPVDTGKKIHPAGAVFDVDKDEAEQLAACGAVEIVGAKKAAGDDTRSANPEPGDDDRGAGAGDGNPEGGSADGDGQPG